MQFPIVKKEDQSLALEIPDDLLQQVTSKLSSQAEAQLKESQDKVGELEGKLAEAEGKTLGDFTPQEKADFVITWAKGLSPEDKAIFATAVGIPIVGAAAAKVAEVEGEPNIIEGKTDRPGYRFLEHLNLSIKEE